MMAIKLKGAKGGFVFRPIYFIPGLMLMYTVFFLDQYGWLSVVPQLVFGLIGGRLFIMGFYEKNNKKFKSYKENKRKDAENRFFSVLFISFALLFSEIGRAHV